jgi:hypothetical protein
VSDQRDMFSRGRELKIARSTWRNAILERTIVKSLMDTLPLFKIRVIRINAPIPCPRCKTFSTQPNVAGIPDIVGWVPPGVLSEGGPWGRPLFIEVKRPKGGREEIEQKEFIERAKSEGAIAIFARGWDECAEQLRANGVKLPEAV